MNVQLKTVMDFIQQNENISAEEKSMLVKEVKKVSSDLEIAEFKLERTEKVKRTTAILLEETIEELEQKRKAVEAQNHELEIESSLERVRSVAMGIQNPAEMVDVCKIISEQLEFLKVKDIRNVQTAVIYESKGTYINYEYYARHNKLLTTEVSYKTHHLQEQFANQMLKGAGEFFSPSLEGQQVKDWYEYQKTTNQFADSFLEGAQTLNYYMFSLGPVALGISTYSPLKEEEINLFKRFRNVFELAYRRFLDIQKAEAQAREAQIEAALERIRSRALAMHNSAEVGDVSDLLFSELEKMDINPTGFSIMIFDREQDRYELWRAKEVAHQGVYETFSIKSMFDKLDQHIPGFTEELESKWNSGSPLFIAELSGKKRISFIEANREMGNYTEDQFENVLKIYPDPVFWHLVFFKHGWLGLIQNEQLPADVLQVIRRFADVFEFAHTRFLDLQKAEANALRAEEDLIAIKVAREKAEVALAELKSTQFQLIQSEKMASLGELTAGIAHEIQNPLNFVNNFSEVSNELIDEMKEELAVGNMQLANEIAEDIKQNLEKINHHGKRAADIVKGMLLHSRTSSGQKEPTDINALADEYLRLTYHGLRAKDKSFNADFKTEFDESLPKINVIPQDIGRVLLNLINNAFYAVDKWAKEENPLPHKGGSEERSIEYKPAVIVSTTSSKSPSGNLGVKIRVKDNGPGIPPHIIDKIFQPFFTTKPTGQGTGLGLSLSYDIVKAHGGELKVETKEGEGAEFTIIIPITKNISNV